MRNIVIFIFLCGISLAACTTQEDKLAKTYSGYVELMKKNQFERVPDSIAPLMHEFGKLYPKHPQSPQFMFFAAAKKSQMNETYQSAVWYEECYLQFPKDSMAIFALAGAISNYGNAKNGHSKYVEMLERLVKDFPKHPMAASTRLELERAKKGPLTPDQELEMILNQKKNKDSASR